MSGALRRRLVAGVLAVASLAMITAYFRESESGAMHDVQSVAASALEPFETGADRLVRPFRDAWGYVSGLIDAKSENDALRKQVVLHRSEANQNRAAVQELKELQALLDYQRSLRLEDYRSVSAEVIADPVSRHRQQIVIAAGHDDGIRRDYPVVATGGLVGLVTKVTRETAQVTLLTDSTSSVSAYDSSTEAYGVIRGHGADRPLVFDRVPKAKSVGRGHPVLTSGRRYQRLASLYPRAIEIGTVKSVVHRDTENFKSIQVDPYVDFSSLQAVLVLVPKAPVSELPSDDAR